MSCSPEPVRPTTSVCRPLRSRRHGCPSEHRPRLTAHVSTRTRDAIVSFGDFASGPSSDEKNARRLALLRKLAASVGRVRMLGSAATDLAWLAAGRLDAVVIDANRAWDDTAGIAISVAAGATVTHLDGSAYTLDGPDVLAATPSVHDCVVTILE
ncbi:inositol monophosphatase family protein [Oerskovia sp. NPDC056781]|uniref:inositol monophosphatase family protein n=1 Tax=Oerskovia sp. NPDC056781 TaxID=3345942 RepID=UPI00366BB1D6